MLLARLCCHLTYFGRGGEELLQRVVVAVVVLVVAVIVFSPAAVDRQPNSSSRQNKMATRGFSDSAKNSRHK